MANIQSGGTVDVSVNHKPSGALHLSAHQSNISNAGDVLVAFNGITYGFTDAIEDLANHKITPIVPGHYNICTLITLGDCTIDIMYIVTVCKNGATVIMTYQKRCVVNGELQLGGSQAFYMSANEYITVKVNTGGTSNVDIIGGYNKSMLRLQRER